MPAGISNSVVKIEGLSELRRSLKSLGEADRLMQVQRALRTGADVVRDDARRRVPSRTGRARASINSSGGGAAAYVTGGKKSVRYYAWLDFGSRDPRRGLPRSMGPWKRSGAGPVKGRFLYPAFDAKREEVAALVQRAIDEAISERGMG
jgi:HK97 gp10 family phage protein